jgi:hypothetical protein
MTMHGVELAWLVYDKTGRSVGATHYALDAATLAIANGGCVRRDGRTWRPSPDDSALDMADVMIRDRRPAWASGLTSSDIR